MVVNVKDISKIVVKFLQGSVVTQTVQGLALYCAYISSCKLPVVYVPKYEDWLSRPSYSNEKMVQFFAHSVCWKQLDSEIKSVGL